MKAIIVSLLLLSGATQAQLDIQHWTTPEGAKVLFAKTQGLPMLDIQLNFAAASATDGELFGLASLTNNLLATATKYRSEEQIIDAFESVGAQFSAYSLTDMAIVSLRTLTRKSSAKKALDALTEVITLPNFKQAYLTREKRQTLRKIEANKQSPASVASNAFKAAVFANHPYAHPNIGTAKTLNNISLADIKQHYKTHYVAKNLTIALVGDITTQYAKQIARKISNGLNIGQKSKPHSTITKLKNAQKIHLDFPSKQTHLLIGQTGINRSHPDYYPLYLGNHILGGNGLSSILSHKIREQLGLAYSTASYFTKMQSNGYFLIKLQTKNASTKTAEKLAIQTLQDFLQQPLKPEELQDGKDNIIGGFALQTASNANILTYLSIIGFYDLPLDYLNTFTDKIKNITAKDIQNAFSRLIDMDKLIVVSVGQK